MKIDHISLCNHPARRMHIHSNKPVMIFVPGALQDIESIKNLNAGFSANFDYHVIELPGSGLAGPLHSSYPVAFLGECLREYIDTYVHGSFHLVSCSYATGLAIEYAKQFGHHIESLTLAGAMQEIPASAWPVVLGLMSDSLGDTEKFASNFVELLTNSNGAIPKVDVIKKATLRKTRSYTHAEYWTFIYNTIRLMSYRAVDLELIRCPTLCFTGEHDPFVTPQNCKHLADQIPGALFDTIPSTDHLFHIENSGATIEMITSFIHERSQIAA